MIFRLLNSAILASLLFLFAVIAYAVLEVPPTTDDLDSDLMAIHKSVAAAEAESGKYESGAIKTIIELELRTLSATARMLEQKRLSVLRRIALDYRIETVSKRPGSAETLAAIEKDIADADRKAAAAQLEASKYNGGLIQAMSLVSAATERFSKSILQLKYYSEKYAIGIDLPEIKPPEQPKTNPGKIVRDKEAL